MVTRTLILKIITALTTSLSLVACSQQKFSIENESRNYEQKVTYNTDVDILWVIDTSSSMDRHQNLLADQVGLFVGALNETGLTYQMAVTTMDMGSGGARGRFLAQVGTPRVLTPQTRDLVSVLSQRLRIGDQGSAVERGQEAMFAALTPPLSTTGVNAGFLRPESLLVVIFLTDEEDQSAVYDYAGFLDDLRPPLPLGDRSWVAHFMGVTPNDPNCKTSEWGYSSPGSRYIELANISGGAVETICDADLRRSLTNVKARILEVVTEYPLEREPIENSIQVYVNGIAVPRDATNGWTYQVRSRSIRFHGTAIPKAGASIHVTFDPAGMKD